MPIVKWIECGPPKPEIRVRLPVGIQDSLKVESLKAYKIQIPLSPPLTRGK